MAKSPNKPANLPSKTGKPSGPGRSNNPPAKPASSPAPKPKGK